jgi:hypothetical protein
MYRKNIFVFLSVIIGAFCLLIPAFYNGYPLVNPDTATYLASGFKPETPMDRPITYGILIRLLSLNGLSLWLVAFAQAVIVSVLIFKILKSIWGDRSFWGSSLAGLLFLSVCSSLSWLASQVQPDVFTSIAFLCIVVILLDKKPKAFYYVLFFIAVAVHLSHPVLMVGTLLLLLIFQKVYLAEGQRVTGRIALMIGLSLASILLMGSALSKSKHVFFMGSLLEKGVLKKYLDDNCASNSYKLCAYKDALPKTADEFWWNNESPLYKTGDWSGTKTEFNDIIHHILTNPTYLGAYLAATGKQFTQQAVTYNIGDGNQKFPTGSNVNQRIAEYFPREIRSFNESRQNSVDMLGAFRVPNNVFQVVVIVALLVVIYAVTRWGDLSRALKLLFIVCLPGVLFNCLDCAAFGTLNGRYGAKMIWLIPLCAVAFLATRLFREEQIA